MHEISNSCWSSPTEFIEEAGPSNVCRLVMEWPPPTGPVPIVQNQAKWGWAVYGTDETSDFVWFAPEMRLTIAHPEAINTVPASAAIWTFVRCDTAPYLQTAQGGCIVLWSWTSGGRKYPELTLSLRDAEVEDAAAFYQYAIEDIPGHPGGMT
jgi:hypothetical protein